MDLMKQVHEIMCDWWRIYGTCRWSSL